jgi:hypothetical protein
MTAADEVAAVLDRAADYIDVNGWCQGQAFSPNLSGPPKACARGALIMANKHFDPNTVERADALVRYEVSVDSSRFGLNIGFWNDRPGRTQGDVTDMFRTLAKRLRDGEVTV